MNGITQFHTRFDCAKPPSVLSIRSLLSKHTRYMPAMSSRACAQKPISVVSKFSSVPMIPE